MTTMYGSTDQAPSPLVYTALQQVALELGPIAKREVRGRGFSAFNVDDVYDELRPLLAKHGVIVAPQAPSVDYTKHETQGGAIQTEARVMGRWKVFGLDGSYVDWAFEASARDSGDKAPIQAAQQALKYAFVHAFQIAAGDPDAEQPPEPAMSEDEIRERRVNYVKLEMLRHFVADGADITSVAKEDAGVLLKQAQESAGVPVILNESDADRVVKAAEKIMAPDESNGAAVPVETAAPTEPVQSDLLNGDDT